jgi:hypothetical protein
MRKMTRREAATTDLKKILEVIAICFKNDFNRTGEPITAEEGERWIRAYINHRTKDKRTHKDALQAICTLIGVPQSPHVNPGSTEILGWLEEYIERRDDEMEAVLSGHIAITTAIGKES